MLGEGPWQLGELGGKYMRTIKTSSIHLASLINDILDAAAASKGSLAIKLERVRSFPSFSLPFSPLFCLPFSFPKNAAAQLL